MGLNIKPYFKTVLLLGGISYAFIAYSILDDFIQITISNNAIVFIFGALSALIALSLFLRFYEAIR